MADGDSTNVLAFDPRLNTEGLPGAPPKTPLQDFASGLGEFKAAGAREVAVAKGAAERKRAEAGELGTLQEKQAAEEKAARPAPTTLPEVPSTAARPFLSPGKGFLDQIQTAIVGATQVAMGMRGATKGGGYATASLAGLTGALEGWKAGDADRVKRSLTEWKSNSERLLEHARLRRESYNDLLTSNRQDMANRLAQIAINARIDGDEQLAAAAERQNVGDVLKIQSEREIQQQQFALTLAKLQEHHDEYTQNQTRLDRAADEALRHHLVTEQQAREKAEPKPLKPADRIKFVAPIEAAETATKMLDEIEGAAGRLGPLIPSGESRLDMWKAAGERWLKPGDKSFVQFQQLWGPVMIGLIDRGAFDEKGMRALAIFKAQIDASGNIPPLASIKELFGTLRESLKRKAEQRQEDLVDIGDEKLIARGQRILDRLNKPPGEDTSATWQLRNKNTGQIRAYQPEPGETEPPAGYERVQSGVHG